MVVSLCTAVAATSCLPQAAFKLSFSTFAGVKLAKLTFGGGDLEDLLCQLPVELLAEIAVALQCSSFISALPVSRRWHEVLNKEAHWERVCRRNWPGITHNLCNSWKKFAVAGGGEMLGACLLHYLKTTTMEAMKCHKQCGLQCCLTESRGHCCDFCGAADHSKPMRTRYCRQCHTHRCDKCYKAIQPLDAIVNGAANCMSSDGWSALHYACRLGFAGVVDSLLYARANIEFSDHLHGYTPLMVASTHGHEDVCSLLLERGASRKAMNHYGRTAVDCALSWGHSSLVTLMS
jgi:hypothetical protein